MSVLRSAAAFAATILVASLCLSSARAQTMRVSLDQLTESSDDIVVGKTLRTESYWTDDRSAILTRVFIQVDESLRGGAAGERLITVPGGQVGKYLHEVSDMPVFVPDEEVVVFTARHESGLIIVAGGSQGKLEVVRDAQTGVRSVRGAAHLLREERGEGASMKDIGVKEMGESSERLVVPLQELVRRVKARQ